MSHEHVYVEFVRTQADGTDLVRCKCGHESALRLAKQKPEVIEAKPDPAQALVAG